MIVVFTLAASAELREIEAYVGAEDSGAAVRVVDGLVASCMSLEGAPHLGTTIGTVRGVRFRRLVRAPYLIIYSIDRDVIRIHRIRHGARSPKSLLKDLDLS